MNTSSRLWRKEEPIIKNGIVTSGGMFAHQREWWDSPAFIRSLVTGYGGGKTFTAAKRAISMALLNGPIPYMSISPSYRIAKRTIIPEITRLLDGKRIRYKYNKSEHEFTIWHRGRLGFIWIGSGENPDALKGPNVCGAGIDEPFIQPVEVFNQMLARVRHPSAKRREINLTGTPEQLNWGYDICEGEDKGRYDIALIQVGSDANKALPDEYLDTLNRAYDDKMREAYVGGKFVNMSTGLVYYGFSRERNVREYDIPDTELRLGMDFNVDPMAAAVFWTQGEHMHYIDEIELPNSDTEEMVKEAVGRYPRITTAYPDPAGRARHTSSSVGMTDFRIIEGAGLQVQARRKHPSRRDRYNATNKKLSNGTLTVSSKCKRLIRYFEQLTHERFTQQADMTHLTDAATYPVEYIYPIKRTTIVTQRYV